MSIEKQRHRSSMVQPRERMEKRGTRLHLRACPFCDEPMSGEPEFREHLRFECDEAPREVEYR